MKILIINQPINNRGDEAAHRSIIRMLNKEYESAIVNVLFVRQNQNSVKQFTVDNPNNNYLNIQGFKGMSFFSKLSLRYSLHNLTTLVYPIHRKIYKYIGEADLVICAPGGVCMGPYQSWLHIWFLQVALSLNKKIVYYSRSFGPFPEATLSNRIFKRISINLLNNMDFISLRDHVSQNFADELGLNYIASIDTAFLDTPRAKIPTNIIKNIGNDYIVFVPNNLIWHPYFRNLNPDILKQFYVSIINLIIKRDSSVKIIMLPQLFNSGNGNDIIYFKEISSLINNDNIIVLDDGYGSDIQQSIISNASLVIGARYHSIVFAINNNVKFIALSYEHKISGMLKLLSMDDRNIDLLFLLDKEESRDNVMEKILSKINDLLCDKTSLVSNKNAREIAIKCSTLFLNKYKK